MSSAVQDVPDQESSGIRNTGFPEPLSHDRNTTLPHPDADLSPDACIESFDPVPVARSSFRSRFFSSSRVSSNLSNGFIDQNDGTKPGSSASSKDSDVGSKSGEGDSSEGNLLKRSLRGLFNKG